MINEGVSTHLKKQTVSVRDPLRQCREHLLEMNSRELENKNRTKKNLSDIYLIRSEISI